MNPLLLIDGYKLDHRRQYPEKTERVYSNLTARGSRIPGTTDVVFVGLQYFLQRFEFRAIPEGSSVPLRVPMLTVENTHNDFAWLVNYYETLLSACLWMPCTSATAAVRLRALFDRYAETTGSPADFVPWQGHDFSMRGMAGPEAAALSGMGHLVAS